MFKNIKFEDFFLIFCLFNLVCVLFSFNFFFFKRTLQLYYQSQFHEKAIRKKYFIMHSTGICYSLFIESCLSFLLWNTYSFYYTFDKCRWRWTRPLKWRTCEATLILLVSTHKRYTEVEKRLAEEWDILNSDQINLQWSWSEIKEDGFDFSSSWNVTENRWCDVSDQHSRVRCE